MSQAITVVGEQYHLHLGAVGAPMVKVTVFDSDDASRLMRQFIQRGNFGGSELKKGCGKITDAKGGHIATIAYNGRVVLPNGSFLDGMSGSEWLAFCAGQ